MYMKIELLYCGWSYRSMKNWVVVEGKDGSAAFRA